MAVRSAQAGEWLTVADRLPASIRILIAQRPDEPVAAHPESHRRFCTIPENGSLSELPERFIGEWYQAEFNGGLRRCASATMTPW
jgi:hypothetical protein